jgi:pyruvate/2-oxoglutarate dehydrogenase complex dihydrolipoamide acyltransferase (E2) component
MPQAKRADAKPASSAKTTPGRAQTKRASAGASTGAARTAGSTPSQARRTSSSTRARPSTAKASANESATAKAAALTDAAQEATAERLRKLNERIIEAGKHTGQMTLSSYEKTLKAIAGAVERGPGSSDIDWISHLATSQAKFIREFTEAWTSAARGMLK